MKMKIIITEENKTIEKSVVIDALWWSTLMGRTMWNNCLIILEFTS